MASQTQQEGSLLSTIANTIRKVPRGRVSTYGAIAKAAGYPRNARYVASVLRRVGGLPWQRILGSGGRIALRGEAALEQRFLLEAEGIRFRGRRVNLALFEHKFAAKARAAGVKKKAAARRLPRKL